MGPDLGAMLFLPSRKDLLGGRVPGNWIGHQERQGKTELLGNKLQALEFGHIGHPRRRLGIVSGKEALFLHINGDGQIQGFIQGLNSHVVII
jgi:hypothetical protein